jgi:hypothetical protein
MSDGGYFIGISWMCTMTVQSRISAVSVTSLSLEWKTLSPIPFKDGERDLDSPMKKEESGAKW